MFFKEIGFSTASIKTRLFVLKEIKIGYQQLLIENEYRAFLLSRLPQPISYRCNE
jgi:hypothetical protein